VGRVVFNHQLNVQASRDIRLDRAQELEKLLIPVTPNAEPDNHGGRHVESLQQHAGTMPRVVVAASFWLTGMQMRQRLRANQGLGPAILVDAKYLRTLGRCLIERDDVASLLDEEVVTGDLEALAAVRLQPEGPPEAVDGRRHMAHRRGHRAPASIGAVGRRLVQELVDHVRDLLVVDRVRRLEPKFVIEAVQLPPGKESPHPCG